VRGFVSAPPSYRVHLHIMRTRAQILRLMMKINLAGKERECLLSHTWPDVRNRSSSVEWSFTRHSRGAPHSRGTQTGVATFAAAAAAGGGGGGGQWCHFKTCTISAARTQLTRMDNKSREDARALRSSVSCKFRDNERVAARVSNRPTN